MEFDVEDPSEVVEELTNRGVVGTYTIRVKGSVKDGVSMHEAKEQMRAILNKGIISQSSEYGKYINSLHVEVVE